MEYEKDRCFKNLKRELQEKIAHLEHKLAFTRELLQAVCQLEVSPQKGARGSPVD